MTSGFTNSAGTDLDSLFYSDNGNAGALGYKNSSGTDLGNKYTSSATLGYSVGYKNSAGTDLGYLRGNTDSTTPSGLTATTSGSLAYDEIVHSSGDTESDPWTYISCIYGLIYLTPTISNYSSSASYSFVIVFTHSASVGSISSSSGSIFYPSYYSSSNICYMFSTKSGETAYSLGSTITLGYTGANTYAFRLADPSRVFGYGNGTCVCYKLGYSYYIKNNTSGNVSTTVSGSLSVSASCYS